MRNLIEYPIKADEAIFSLQIALERHAKDAEIDGVGSIDGLALIMAEKYIEANREEFEKFTKNEMFKVLR